MKVDDLIERDEPVCIWCGRAVWRAGLTLEHLLPRSRSGRGEPENLALACRQCNRRRRSRSVAAYLRAQRDAGLSPRPDLIEAALTRLAGSTSPPHRDYGRRQLTLVRRMLHPMDLGDPISYEALAKGTPVYSSDEQQIGTVGHVLFDESEDVFDGIVVSEHLGREGHRFADADDVDRIYERGVVLKLDHVASEALPEPTANPAVMHDDPAESDSEFRHSKLRRAWDLISGNY